MPKIEEELKRMKETGIIERVTEPKEWCAPRVSVQKSNGKEALKTRTAHLGRYRAQTCWYPVLFQT